MERFTRAMILRALEALATRLPADSSHHLVVVGGAALVLLYGARDSTKDIDAFLLGAGRAELLREAAAMKVSAWRDDLDVADARVLLSKLQGDRQEVWRRIEPYLVPGRELKAQYAFADLWEARGGTD